MRGPLVRGRRVCCAQRHASHRYTFSRRVCHYRPKLPSPPPRLRVLDITAQPKAVVATDRFIKLDYHRQLARIEALGTRFGVGAVVAERNAVGDPLTEQLRRDLPVPVHPFTTTAVSKRQGLDRLILAFERQEIALLRDDALIHELLAYSARTLPSGLIQYGAPPGGHDDLVMALMLAWEGSRFVLTQEQWRALQRAYRW